MNAVEVFIQVIHW